MTRGAKKIIRTIKNAVFPRFCVNCRLEGRLLCEDCNVNWQPTGINFDKISERHLASFNYADPIARQLICAWKYHYDTSAWEHLKVKLRPGLANLRHIIHSRAIEAIVPIPLHNRRLCERGFDQAVEIGRFISKEMDLPMLELLVRQRSTGKQAEREVDDRILSMQNNPFIFRQISPSTSWAKSRHDLPNGETTNLPTSIILVDDVWTTGATAGAAVEILKKAGVDEILIYTLATGK